MPFYSDDDMLQLSGIQHFCFCPRQWALQTIEQQWADNRLTVEGSVMHRNVDDPFHRLNDSGLPELRSVHIASHELGLYGIADLVELQPLDDNLPGMRLPGVPGNWLPCPVEYKHGRPKGNRCDEVQVAAQAMCLEEMYGIAIPRGAVFYGQTRRRMEVILDEELRKLTRSSAEEMHALFRRGALPPPKYEKYCENCSLIDICLPKVSLCPRASQYLEENLYP